MLTSSFSSAARAKSRRSRGSRRFGIRGSRKRIAASVAVPCAYSASISSTVAGCEPRRAPDVAAGRGEPQLVGDDLHRGREIERRVVGVRGNRRDDAATRELGVGQPRHLGAEHERDVAVRRVRDRLGARPRARPARGPRIRAAAPKARWRRRSRRALRRASRRRVAPSSTTVAPDASATASGSGKRRGATSTSRARPIVSIARAAAPMLPGWLGATSTMRMRREAAGVADVIGAPSRHGSSRRRAAVTMSTFVPTSAPPSSAAQHEPTDHASDAHHRRESGAPRRQRHQSRRARPRPAHGHVEGAQGFRERSGPRSGAGDRRDAARQPIPTTRF